MTSRYEVATAISPTAEERAAWEECQELWQQVTRGRATVDLRTASPPRRAKADRAARLQETIRPEVIRLLVDEGHAAWEARRQRKVTAAREQIAMSGWHEGDRVRAVLSWWTGTGASVYEGEIKVSKHGDVYVLCRGEHYDLWQNTWQKV